MANESLPNSYSKKQVKRADHYAELYRAGLSLSQVGAVYGVSRQSVYEALKRRGVELRSKTQLIPQVFNGVKFTLRNNGYYGRTDEDRELMHRYVWRYYFGDIPSGYDIHHKNRNRVDNRIENLECLPKAEHSRRYNTGCNQVAHRCGK